MQSMEQFRQFLKQQLEAQGFDVDALDQGSAHPYSCTCETCWKWWKQMGLGDEDNPPFTQMEIDQNTYEEACNLFPKNPETGYVGKPGESPNGDR